MRAYIYADQASAQADADVIWDRGRAIAAQQGHTVTAEGIVAPGGGITTHWAVPREVAGVGWIVPHPERHPAATPEYLASITQGITAPVQDVDLSEDESP